MKIRKIGHSCVLIEEKNEKLLIDPGNYCFMNGRIDPSGITANFVLITHEHADHVDIPALKIIVSKNNAKIFGNKNVTAMLEKEGIQAEVFEEGRKKLGNFEVQAINASHEKILVTAPQNTAYLVDKKFLHPGDSLGTCLYEFEGVQVLALPVAAPWANHIKMAEFAKAVKPKTVIPIHDGYVIDYFRNGQYGIYEKYLEEFGISFTRLETPEEILEI